MINWTDLLKKDIASFNPYRYSPYNGAPKIVVWNTTSRCNLECRHCYFDAGNRRDSGELSKEEAIDFISDLAGMKVPVLLFSGGEPLLREDIFELGRIAKERGIRPILSTNGTLITADTAKKIKEAGFSYVGVSLDGTRDINDRFRRQRGAFSRALGGIINCRKAGLKVGVRFTVTDYNFKALADIFDLVERENIPRFCIYHLVYTGRGGNLTSRDISHSQRKDVLELIWQRVNNGLDTEVLTVDNHADGAWLYLKLRSSDPKRAEKVLELLSAQGGNGSGEKIGAVDNYGYIHPDQFWRGHSPGSIREKKFSEVWPDKKNGILKSLRERKNFIKGRCGRCNFLDICNGNFRARAEAVSGDIWGEDPGCYLTEEEIKG